MTLSRLLQLSRTALRHLRQGSLREAVAQKLDQRRAGRAVAAPPSPPPPAPNRYHARTEADAAKVLVDLAADSRRPGADTVLVIGNGDSYMDRVLRQLAERQVRTRTAAPGQAAQFAAIAGPGLAAVAVATTDSRSHLELARQLVHDPQLADVPLEYVAVPQLENAPMTRWDGYGNEDFVSPMLATAGSRWYEIFEEALKHFEFKTDIRDFLDLGQLLQSVVTRKVNGNVAEFGSYRGHSGYLISRLLESMGSDKHLYMFDMFDSFPQEPVGVDRFWSGTHPVNFADVERKFVERPNVRLVQGDFTVTLGQTDTGPLALAYIDCDSYRATRHLLKEVWNERLSVGGLAVMEDYGHAALLGNRLAVHEFFDGRRDAFTWFSHFSGFFVGLKLPQA